MPMLRSNRLYRRACQSWHFLPRWWPPLWVTVILAVLTGCSPPMDNATAQPSTPATSPAESQPQGQRLPISARVDLGGTEFFLEVAETPRQQAMGLMFRPPLPDDRGMLFPFSPPRPVSFWMGNVPVPLDMVFIYDDTVQAITHSAPPCPARPCPTYGAGEQPIDYVIELRGGRAEDIGLEVGDAAVVTPLETPRPSP